MQFKTTDNPHLRAAALERPEAEAHQPKRAAQRAAKLREVVAACIGERGQQLRQRRRRRRAPVLPGASGARAAAAERAAASAAAVGCGAWAPPRACTATEARCLHSYRRSARAAEVGWSCTQIRSPRSMEGSRLVLDNTSMKLKTAKICSGHGGVRPCELGAADGCANRQLRCSHSSAARCIAPPANLPRPSCRCNHSHAHRFVSTHIASVTVPAAARRRAHQIIMQAATIEPIAVATPTRNPV